MNGKKRVTTTAYKIRTSSGNATILKSIVYKISLDVTNKLKFSPYWLNSVNPKGSKKNQIQQNNFFAQIAIGFPCKWSHIPSHKIKKDKEIDDTRMY